MQNNSNRFETKFQFSLLPSLECSQHSTHNNRQNSPLCVSTLPHIPYWLLCFSRQAPWVPLRVGGFQGGGAGGMLTRNSPPAASHAPRVPSTSTHTPAMRYSFFPPTSSETPQMADEGAV